MMNILVISTVRYRANGVSNVIKNLYGNEGLSNENISFLFPADNDPVMLSELEQFGYRVYEFPRYQKGTYAYFRYLKKLVKDTKAEIVHIHGNSHALLVELLAAKLSGCKKAICHSHNTTSNNILAHKILSPVFNMLCDGRLACGKDAGIWMYGHHDFQVINNGIRTDRFVFRSEERKQIREKYNIQEDEFVIGHVGNLNEQKNQTVLLDIMAELVTKVNCRCLLIGEGHKRPELEQKTKTLHLEDKVVFCGVTSEVPSYLCALDCIAMPSLYEGLPLALIEEQASGLPCVVAGTITEEVNITGNVSFIDDLNDITKWVDQIMFVLNEKRNRIEVSEKNSKMIREAGYDITTEIIKLKHYYQLLLKGE